MTPVTLSDVRKAVELLMDEARMKEKSEVESLIEMVNQAPDLFNVIRVVHDVLTSTARGESMDLSLFGDRAAATRLLRAIDRDIGRVVKEPLLGMEGYKP